MSTGASPDERTGEDIERTSGFDGSHGSWARLVRTIVAMANTHGGVIRLQDVRVELHELQTARVDERVHAEAGPRIMGIEAAVTGERACEVTVPASPDEPHAFLRELRAGDGGGGEVLVHAGQIWVRRAGRDEPASPDDLRRIVKERIALALDALREKVLHGNGPLVLGPTGTPVRYADEPGAVAVVPDLEATHPYTTRTLGIAVGKSQNWVAAAVECLGLKGRPAFWVGVRSRHGFAAQRYSEAAAELVRARIAQDPAWNPFAERGRKRAALDGAAADDRPYATGDRPRPDDLPREPQR